MWLFSDFDIGGPAGQVNSIFFIFLSKNVLCSLSLLIICSEYIVNALFRGHCFWKGVFDTQSPPSAFSPHYSVTLFNVGSHCTVHNLPGRFELFILSKSTGNSRLKVVRIVMATKEYRTDDHAQLITHAPFFTTQ